MAPTQKTEARPQEAPFFIVGSSRSGTTMFRLMLNAHRRLLIPGETWFLKDLMDRFPLREPLHPDQVDEIVSTVRSHWRWKEWKLPDRLLEEALRTLEAPQLEEVVQALYHLPLDASGKARWGDKTPGYLMEIERLHRMLPRARFLHVIRDGRDVCLSLKRTGWHGETTWEIAQYWGQSVLHACRAGRVLPAGHYLEVRYEDLVLDTEATLRGVCTFLQEEFDSAMLAFFETADENIPARTRSHLSKTSRPPRKGDVERWKREMKSRQRAIFEAFAGDALEAAGYERRHRRGLPVIRGACRVVDRVAEVSLPLRRRLGLHFPHLRRSL